MFTAVQRGRMHNGHSIRRALAQANVAGMREPPLRVRRILAFAEEIHLNHEFRYPHLHRPRFIESRYLIFAGAWVLRAAAPAVVRDTVAARALGRRELEATMRRGATQLIEWARPKAPPSGDKLML